MNENAPRKKRSHHGLRFESDMLFTEHEQSAIFDLHDIDMIRAVSLFQFTRYLQVLNSLPFFNFQNIAASEPVSLYDIYKILIGSRQFPFLNLQHIYRV